MLLAGDIGGTKTNLALFSKEKGPHIPLFEKSFSSLKYTSLESIIEEYLSKVEETPENACFGVAGPVLDGRAKITNLSWSIDERLLESRFNLGKVKLLNDLESIGYCVPVLEKEDIHTIHPGELVRGGNIAILAPGTGLGEAFLTSSEDGYRVHASEGSHVSFGPIDSLQLELLHYMRYEKGYEHVSYERVCSGGLGIPNIYAFLKDTAKATEPAWLAEKLKDCEDQTAVIVQAAMDKDTPDTLLCIGVLNLFVSILGAEAGNLALKVLATGGIYLGGGIPPRIINRLHKTDFLESIRNKGRFKEMLTEIPVHVIVNPKAGLMGAAAYWLKPDITSVQ